MSTRADHPATIIDSLVFGDIFSSAAMREVFSDQNRVAQYLAVEAALARVQGRLGVIPQQAADEIVRHCEVGEMDFERLKERTERVGYPVLPVVEQLVEHCADGLGQYCHWGATTQDITDTATVLQIRQALGLIDADLAALARALADLAERYRDTPMAGRSNLQQAIPMTFGFKAARLLATVERHRARIAQMRPRVLVGEFGGAVGTLASLGNDGLAVQQALMQELALGQPEIAWHTERDRIAEVGCLVGLVTGTLAKLATDVKLLMQTEVGEAFEPYAPGRGSSSTMPQKRNPISCAYIHSCAAVVRQHVAALLEAMAADHERSTGPWEIEWISLPEVFCLTSGALKQARTIVEGLEVNPEAMMRDLELTHGLNQTEAVMMALAPDIGRERAHDLIYGAAHAAMTDQRPVLDALAQDPEISKHLDRGALRELLDPCHYLGLSASMVDRVLAQSTASSHGDTAAARAPGGNSVAESAAVRPERPASNERSEG
jgi:3-carboxy-cis,cis-muconate cycloisomerase